MIWAVAEHREADVQMEESNVIKLALMLAKERGWQEVVIQGTNKRLI